MNIANVASRFRELSGVDPGEYEAVRLLLEQAAEYIDRRRTTDQPDSGQQSRLELIAAAYALSLYDAVNSDSLTSFSAGDVKFTSPAGGESRGAKLYRALAEANSDLIEPEKFLFGRV